MAMRIDESREQKMIAQINDGGFFGVGLASFNGMDESIADDQIAVFQHATSHGNQGRKLDSQVGMCVHGTVLKE